MRGEVADAIDIAGGVGSVSDPRGGHYAGCPYHRVRRSGDGE